MEAMDKWPCGDCFTFYFTMLRNDILIENSKYDYIYYAKYWNNENS